jgi:hypothetical protein
MLSYEIIRVIMFKEYFQALPIKAEFFGCKLTSTKIKHLKLFSFIERFHLYRFFHLNFHTKHLSSKLK